MKYAGIVNLRKRNLHLGKQIFPLSENPTHVQMYANIRLSETIRVPPDTEFYCQGHIQGKFSTEYGSIEPKQIVNVNGLLMVKTLIDPRKEEISLLLLNLTNRPVKLNENMHIADLKPVETVHQITPRSPTQSKGTQLPEHLCTLFDRITYETNLKEKNQIKNLLLEFEDIFLELDGNLGCTDLVECSIDTGSENPVKMPPRRLSPRRKEIIDKELQKMLDKKDHCT
jgi:hypothetical protein